MDRDKTKVIGNPSNTTDYTEEYKQFNNVYQDDMQDVDELAYLDQVDNKYSRNIYEQEEINQEYITKGNTNNGSRSDAHNKKKRKKPIIAAVIIILAVLGAAGGFFIFSGGDSESTNVDLTLLMTEPDVSGYDGEATIGEILVNHNEADKIVAQIGDEDQKAAAVDFFASIEYKADKIEGIKSGDEINITAVYDSVLAQEAGLVITNDKTTFICGQLEEKEEEFSLEEPQWYKNVRAEGDEVAVTCLLIAKTSTSVTLPIEQMFCRAGGAMSEMVDTSGSPNFTYNGTGYYMEGGMEAPYGVITEVDKDHVKYSLKQYGDSFSIVVRYTLNDDGTLNVESAKGGEVQVPTGKYVPISSSEARNLGGR